MAPRPPASIPASRATQGQVSVPNIEALAQQRPRVRQRLGEPRVLADPRHHRERPVRLSHRRDDRGQRAADLDRHALRPPQRRDALLRTPSSASTTSAVEASISARAAVDADAATILQHVRDLGITNYRGILGGALVRLLQLVDVRHQRARRSPTRRTRRPRSRTTRSTSFTSRGTTSPTQPWFLYQAFNAPHAANGGQQPVPGAPSRAPPRRSQLGR